MDEGAGEEREGQEANGAGGGGWWGVEEEGVVGEVAGGEGLLILGRHCSLW